MLCSLVATERGLSLNAVDHVEGMIRHVSLKRQQTQHIQSDCDLYEKYSSLLCFLAASIKLNDSSVLLPFSHLWLLTYFAVWE